MNLTTVGNIKTDTGNMARITIEDCLQNENNRFSLVRLASRRAKQLLSGQTPVTDTRGNKAIVSALREIADGKVKFRRGDDSAGADDDSEVNGNHHDDSDKSI